jgi:hypothetical protein
VQQERISPQGHDDTKKHKETVSLCPWWLRAFVVSGLVPVLSEAGGSILLSSRGVTGSYSLPNP